MKLNRIYIFLIVICSLVLFSCNSNEQTQMSNNTGISGVSEELPDNNTPAPRIVFENKHLDFGKIGPESQPSGEYKFVNAGNEVLDIAKVSQCCGVVISYDKSSYEPGEKGVIKASYTANKQAGKISRMPIVYSNDPVEPELSLLLTAEIENKVVTNPESLKLFLDEDYSDGLKLTVKSTDNQLFAVRGVKSTGNCITGQFNPELKANEIELDLTADMAKLDQNRKGYVDIVVTHPEMSVVEVKFDVVSRFMVTPPKLLALDIMPEEPIIRKMWVYNKYNQDFEIESITSKNNYITVRNLSAVDEGYQFEVEIIPPLQEEGKTSFSDEIYIQIKNSEMLEIQCDGYYHSSEDEDN